MGAGREKQPLARGLDRNRHERGAILLRNQRDADENQTGQHQHRGDARGARLGAVIAGGVVGMAERTKQRCGKNDGGECPRDGTSIDKPTLHVGECISRWTRLSMSSKPAPRVEILRNIRLP